MVGAPVGLGGRSCDDTLTLIAHSSRTECLSAAPAATCQPLVSISSGRGGARVVHYGWRMRWERAAKGSPIYWMCPSRNALSWCGHSSNACALSSVRSATAMRIEW